MKTAITLLFVINSDLFCVKFMKTSKITIIEFQQTIITDISEKS